jgi:hypothetical protein
MNDDLMALEKSGAPMTRALTIQLHALVGSKGVNAKDVFSKCGVVPPAMPTIGQARAILASMPK